MAGYNKSARAMIQYANRKCDNCTYGDWSKTWKKTRIRGDKTLGMTIVYFRLRTCKICRLRKVDTDYKSFWKNAGPGEWKPSNEYSKTPAFTQEVEE